jgi:hypothetical protein
MKAHLNTRTSRLAVIEVPANIAEVEELTLHLDDGRELHFTRAGVMRAFSQQPDDTPPAAPDEGGTAQNAAGEQTTHPSAPDARDVAPTKSIF